MFGRTKAEKTNDYEREAMFIGTTLDRLTTQARNRVLRAAQKAGWAQCHWYTRKNVRALARACRVARDAMLAEGLVQGLDDVDRCMHRLMAWS